MGRYSNTDKLALYRRILAGQERGTPSHRPVPSLRQKQTRLAPDEVFDLVHDYEDGFTVKGLVAKYSISRTTAIAHLKREGIKTRYNKLDSKLEEIKQLRAEGWSYARIGKRYGVVAHTVRRALTPP